MVFNESPHVSERGWIKPYAKLLDKAVEELRGALVWALTALGDDRVQLCDDRCQLTFVDNVRVLDAPVDRQRGFRVLVELGRNHTIKVGRRGCCIECNPRSIPPLVHTNRVAHYRVFVVFGGCGDCKLRRQHLMWRVLGALAARRRGFSRAVAAVGSPRELRKRSIWPCCRRVVEEREEGSPLGAECSGPARLRRCRARSNGEGSIGRVHCCSCHERREEIDLFHERVRNAGCKPWNRDHERYVRSVFKVGLLGKFGVVPQRISVITCSAVQWMEATAVNHAVHIQHANTPMKWGNERRV
eukprot:m.298596 g.298596  ORF g.298596 m.298596 type:complete len:300 (+) comp27222_c0_seq1:162-1061(+)